MSDVAVRKQDFKDVYNKKDCSLYYQLVRYINYNPNTIQVKGIIAKISPVILRDAYYPDLFSPSAFFTPPIYEN